MSGANWLQLGALVGALFITAPLLGVYLARVFSGGDSPGERVFAPVERAIYRVAGVDANREQPWNAYALSLLAFSAVSVLGPVPARAAAGRAAAQPDERRRGAAGAGVQHGGQLRDEHELAELRRRVDDEPSDADGGARGAELRLRCGRAWRSRSRWSAGSPAAASATIGNFWVDLIARDDARAAAARVSWSRCCS